MSTITLATTKGGAGKTTTIRALMGFINLKKGSATVFGKDCRKAAHDLQSQMPFCYDTLRLPQWLQWVFLPRCHQMIKTREGIPENSDIHSLAEYYFEQAGINAGDLLICIRRFDVLITEWNSPEQQQH